MYYAIVMIAVLLFGGSFVINDEYRKKMGDTLEVSLRFALFSSLGSFIVLFIANKGVIDFTVFTLIMAVLTSINGFAYTFCSFKALDKINLSVYSLYSMLGGMLLPFLQGILFYGESFTVAKLVCCLFIAGSLVCTLSKGNASGGAIYYAGVFVFNGMSGVLSKMFTSAPFSKTDPFSFSILCSLSGVIIAVFIIAVFFTKKSSAPKENAKTIGISFAGGTINRLGNLLLLVALVHIDASSQYPLVTGGVIIASTLICFLRKVRPSNKEIVSVALAFAGMLALFLIPV